MEHRPSRKQNRCVVELRLKRHRVEGTKIMYSLVPETYIVPETELADSTIKNVCARSLAKYMEGDEVQIDLPDQGQGDKSGYHCRYVYRLLQSYFTKEDTWLGGWVELMSIFPDDGTKCLPWEYGPSLLRTMVVCSEFCGFQLPFPLYDHAYRGRTCAAPRIVI